MQPSPWCFMYVLLYFQADGACNPHHGVLTSEELQGLARDQVTVELDGLVMVDSIYNPPVINRDKQQQAVSCIYNPPMINIDKQQQNQNCEILLKKCDIFSREKK